MGSTDLQVVECFTQDPAVLDKKISMVLPAWESPKKQIEIRAVKLLCEWNEGIYEVVTFDDAQYFFPLDNSPAPGSERKIFYQRPVDTPCEVR